jgi:alpha-D-ribose 1-methylphosphonate 5-triphosphate synthase subunit PhnL
LADLKAAGVAMIGVFHHPGDVAGLIDREIELTAQEVHEDVAV